MPGKIWRDAIRLMEVKDIGSQIPDFRFLIDDFRSESNCILESEIWNQESEIRQAASARLTARLAPRFNARCTARAYRTKFAPACGYLAKNS